jgi:hypothetical protein
VQELALGALGQAQQAPKHAVGLAHGSPLGKQAVGLDDTLGEILGFDEGLDDSLGDELVLGFEEVLGFDEALGDELELGFEEVLGIDEVLGIELKLGFDD